MTIGEQIGLRLRELRLERGLTQLEVSRRAGMHRPLVARVEGGTYHQPTLDTVRRLARALGVRVVDVVSVLDEEPSAEAAE